MQMKSLKAILCLFVILCSVNVNARMFKCIDSRGKISYGPTPCKADQMEKQIQEPYYNEEALQEEARIVAQREAQGRTIQNQIDTKNLRIQEEMELRDAIAKGDKWRMAVLLKKSRGELSTDKRDSQLSEMQSELNLMQVQKNLMAADKLRMENEMRRLEIQKQQQINQQNVQRTLGNYP